MFVANWSLRRPAPRHASDRRRARPATRFGSDVEPGQRDFESAVERLLAERSPSSGRAARKRSHIAIRAGMLGGEIAVRLRRDRRRVRRAVAAENPESIHCHCAYAVITGLDGALID